MEKKNTCKIAKQVYNQRVWSVLAEQIFYTCQNVILEEQQDAFHFIHKSHRLCVWAGVCVWDSFGVWVRTLGSVPSNEQKPGVLHMPVFAKSRAVLYI